MGRIVAGRCDRQGRFVFATQDAGLQRLHLDLALGATVDAADGAARPQPAP